ncbi:MAG: hypothetical protein ACREC0_15590 [Methylocella sp.]
MPDLKSNFVGRVNRLPLRPSDRNALIPVMEAVSNSVHSITDRFGGDAGTQRHIDIIVVRDLENEDEPIIGFDVEDNGVGFTDANYQSFLTPDSRLKESRGGKGVGRLIWLKRFRNIEIESTFFENGSIYKRQFSFRSSEREQVEELSFGPVDPVSTIKTRVSFRGFESSFGSRCPSRPGTIALRILSHFVPLFIAEMRQKTFIQDGSRIDLEALFPESIKDQSTTTSMLELGGEQVEIVVRSLRCTKSVRFDGGGYNFGFIAGMSRSVIDYSIDDQLGLHLLDGEYLYLGCASGEYLDRNVNSERTAFTLDGAEIDQIRRLIARDAKNFLRSYVEIALAEKVRITKELIVENAQFLYV